MTQKFILAQPGPTRPEGKKPGPTRPVKFLTRPRPRANTARHQFSPALIREIYGICIFFAGINLGVSVFFGQIIS